MDTEDELFKQLVDAVNYGNLEALELLAQSHVDHCASVINRPTGDGQTLLYISVVKGRPACVEQLLAMGSDPNLLCNGKKRKQTALHRAIEEGQAEIVCSLLTDRPRTTAVPASTGSESSPRCNIYREDAAGVSCLQLSRDLRAVRKQSEHICELLEAKNEQYELEANEFYNLCLTFDCEAISRAAKRIFRLDKVINRCPQDSYSLLYRACEHGKADIVDFLVRHGAQCQAHPVTGYTPLYVACGKGNLAIVERLIYQYPKAVAIATTKERMLPLHAACLEGHHDVLNLLLNFNYPEECLQKFYVYSRGGIGTYRAAFDVNAEDVDGFSALQLATLWGHLDVLRCLLSFKVSASFLLDQLTSPTTGDSDAGVLGAAGSDDSQAATNAGAAAAGASVTITDGNRSAVRRVSPLNLRSKGAAVLVLAIKKQQPDIVRCLLGHLAGEVNADVEIEGRPTSPLRVAVESGRLELADLLLRHGAVDKGGQLLTEALSQLEFSSESDPSVASQLVTLLLQHLASSDNVNRINRDQLLGTSGGGGSSIVGGGGDGGLTDCQFECLYPSLPRRAVALRWCGIRRLTGLSVDWLLAACRLHNPHLGLDASPDVALCAVTKIDLSNCGLAELPSELLGLRSLRELSLAGNAIRRLPTDSELPVLASSSSSSASAGDSLLPSLSELSLAGNQLTSLPEWLFTAARLPQLSTLICSGNRIDRLPARIWFAPRLQLLDLADNGLSGLPVKGSPEAWPTAAAAAVAAAEAAAAAAAATNSSLPPNSPIGGGGGGSGGVYGMFLGVGGFEPGGVMVTSLHLNVDTMAEYTGWDEKVLTRSGLRHKSLEVQPNPLADRYNANQYQQQQQQQQHTLNTLILRGNRLRSCPKGLSCLASSLRRLDLGANQITDVSHIWDFPCCLEHLDLSGNSIDSLEEWCRTDIVPDLCFLTQRSLSEHQQQPMPKGCQHRQHRLLDQLKVLNLRGNPVKVLQFSISPGGVGQPVPAAPPPPPTLLFPGLNQLNLSRNQHLTDLPDDVCRMEHLTSLSLAWTAVHQLPPSLSGLHWLSLLELDGCPLQGRVQELAASRALTREILSYLKSVKTESRPYNQLKLMVVGNANIGKTTLINKLRKLEGSVGKSDTWAHRQGLENPGRDSGKILSTVGVDIGDLVMRRKGCRIEEIIFRTWDFGGQKEYYATHQYFLSKRAIYLVVWDLRTGESGMESVHQWLVNIHSRAPRSSVIIVGTHLDALDIDDRQLKEAYLKDMLAYVEKRFMKVNEPSSLGIPIVRNQIHVSCVRGTNLQSLADLLFMTAKDLTLPGSRNSFIVGESIPAIYMDLETVLRDLATERRNQSRDPVLPAEDYAGIVQDRMLDRFGKSFANASELMQATAFLHDVGSILHFKDVGLRDIYFLDPQWLCDLLANVVTTPENNKWVRGGLMPVEHLHWVFHGNSSACRPAEIRSYIVRLLAKFELALLVENDQLLIPSLLPVSSLPQGGPGSRASRIPLWDDTPTPSQELSRLNYQQAAASVATSAAASAATSAAASAAATQQSNGAPNVSGSAAVYVPFPPREPGTEATMFYIKLDDIEARLGGNANQLPPTPQPELRLGPAKTKFSLKCESADISKQLSRLYIMTYFPSGFWPRLLTKLIGDRHFAATAKGLYRLNYLQGVERLSDFPEALRQRAYWLPWQTGVELYACDVLVLSCKEVQSGAASGDSQSELLKSLSYRVLFEGDQHDLATPAERMSLLEIRLPLTDIRLEPSEGLPTRIGSYYLRCRKQAATGLLNKVVEHIDSLLEDWFPDLGTRFNQTAEGMFLVTRLCPCQLCLYAQQINRRGVPKTSWDVVSNDQFPCVIGRVNADSSATRDDVVYCAAVEEFIYNYLEKQVILQCPVHKKDFNAPDLMFQDLDPDKILSIEQVKILSFIGKGNFGTVFSGSIRTKEGEQYAAVKLLVPYPLTADCSEEDQRLYKEEARRWEKEAVQSCCKSYLQARSELHILLRLHHPNVLNLYGVLAPKPLSLLLELAPQGALDRHLASYRQAGYRLPVGVLRSLVYQIADALAHLHSLGIIYRDLKAENCLVWNLPPPPGLGAGGGSDVSAVSGIGDTDGSAVSVVSVGDGAGISAGANATLDAVQGHHGMLRVALADYGISRTTVPDGYRGYAGTLAYMAPEILEFHGEETYTEKADIYSFGMLLYELITLKPPFIDEATKSVRQNLVSYILKGGRPLLYDTDLAGVPVPMLDLLAVCWDQRSRQRPSAAQIRAACQSAAFVRVSDACAMLAAPLCMVLCIGRAGPDSNDLWLASLETSGRQARLETYELDKGRVRRCRLVHTFGLGVRPQAMCVEPDHAKLWVGLSNGILAVFDCDNRDRVAEIPVLRPGQQPQDAFQQLLAARPAVLVFLASGGVRVYGNAAYRQATPSAADVDPPAFELRPTVAHFLPDTGELWLGHCGGRLSVHSFAESLTVLQLAVLDDPDQSATSRANSSKATMTTTALIDSDENGNLVATYAFPGSAVQLWSARTRQHIGRVCLTELLLPELGPALAGCGFSAAECQVTALAFVGAELVLGAASGHVTSYSPATKSPGQLCVRLHRPDEPYVRYLRSAGIGRLLSIGCGYADPIVAAAATVAATDGAFAVASSSVVNRLSTDQLSGEFYPAHLIILSAT